MARQQELPVRKIFSISEEMAKDIEDFRFNHRIGSEAEAIRQLIGYGLSTASELEKSDGEAIPLEK